MSEPSAHRPIAKDALGWFISHVKLMRWIDVPIPNNEVYGLSMKILISILKSCDFPQVGNKM